MNSGVMTPRSVRVHQTKQETADTWTLELDPGAEFVFDPGQFNMLYTMGVGEIPISISGDPNQTQTLVHTIRGVGNVSRALNALSPNQSLGLRGPFGNSWPLDQACGGDVLVIAGGIGLAPLRPGLYQLAANRNAYGAVTLLYGARTPADILYPDQLETWKSTKTFHVRVTVDRANPEWKGNTGFVTELISPIDFRPQKTTVMICGPEIMMRYCARELVTMGCDPARIFLTMERNMKCAVGFCGHCQFGPRFICKDGPIFRYAEMAVPLIQREL